MLDMLTDRCATMCLLATLGTFYPRWLFFFQLSMTIDISCHWIYLHTTTLQVEFAKKPNSTQAENLGLFKALTWKNPEISIQTQPKKAQSFWPRLKPNPTQSIRTENKPNLAQPKALGQKLNQTRPIATSHNPINPENPKNQKKPKNPEKTHVLCQFPQKIYFGY